MNRKNRVVAVVATLVTRATKSQIQDYCAFCDCDCDSCDCNSCNSNDLMETRLKLLFFVGHVTHVDGENSVRTQGLCSACAIQVTLTFRIQDRIFVGICAVVNIRWAQWHVAIVRLYRNKPAIECDSPVECLRWSCDRLRSWTIIWKLGFRLVRFAREQQESGTVRWLVRRAQPVPLFFWAIVIHSPLPSSIPMNWQTNYKANTQPTMISAHLPSGFYLRCFRFKFLRYFIRLCDQMLETKDLYLCAWHCYSILRWCIGSKLLKCMVILFQPTI